MAKVFISYKRDPSFSLAKLISEKLKQADIDVFLDVERMDSAGPFPKRLLREIENADIFICLLATATLDAPWVLREIEHAYTMRKPMIPVFQESYVGPTEPLAHAVATLLDFQGVPVLDKRGLFVDESIAKLARMVKETVQAQTTPPIMDTDDIDTEPIEQKPTVDDDPTQIGDRTFNLRPQTRSRRWLWLVVACLVIVLGIFLFQWVNAPIINAAVAGTQTAVALAETISDTPTLSPTLTLTATPTPPLTPTDSSLAITTPNCASSYVQTSQEPVFVLTLESYVYTNPEYRLTTLGRVSLDQSLVITGVSADGNYYRVLYNEREGWIHRDFGEVVGDTSNLLVATTPILVVTIEAYIYRDLEQSASILGRVVLDERLPITGISADGNYYRVDYGTKEGWILSQFGTVEGDLSTVPAVGNC